MNKMMPLQILLLLIFLSCSFNKGLTNYFFNEGPEVKELKITNKPKPEWIWEKIDGALKYRIKINKNDWTELESTSYTPTENLKDGIYNFELQAYINDKWTGSSFFSTIVDSTPPVIDSAKSLFTSTKETSLNAIISDNFSGIDKTLWIYNETKSGIIINEPDKIETNISLPEYGEYDFTIQITDKAGNISSDNLIVSYFSSTPIFVSSNTGASTNDGSKEKPFLTINQALTSITDSLTNSYIINVAEGIYEEELIINKSNIIIKGGFNNDFSINDRTLYKTEIFSNKSLFTTIKDPISTIKIIDSHNVILQSLNITATDSTSTNYSSAILLNNSEGDIFQCKIFGNNGINSSALTLTNNSNFNLYNNLIHAGKGSYSSRGILLTKENKKSLLIINNNISIGTGSKIATGIENDSDSSINIYNNIISTESSTDYSLTETTAIKGYCNLHYNVLFKNADYTSDNKKWNIQKNIIFDSFCIPIAEITDNFLNEFGRDISLQFSSVVISNDFFGNQRTGSNGIGITPGAIEYNTINNSSFNLISDTTSDFNLLDIRKSPNGTNFLIGLENDNTLGVYQKNIGTNDFKTYYHAGFQPYSNGNKDQIEGECLNDTIILAYKMKNIDNNADLFVMYNEPASGWQFINFDTYKISLDSGISLKTVGNQMAIIIFKNTNDRLICLLYNFGTLTELDFPFKEKANYTDISLLKDDFGRLFFGCYNADNKKFIAAFFSGWQWETIDTNSIPLYSGLANEKITDLKTDGKNFYFIKSVDNNTSLYQYNLADKNWILLTTVDYSGDVDLNIYREIPIFSINKRTEKAKFYYYNGITNVFIADFPEITVKSILFNDNNAIYLTIKDITTGFLKTYQMEIK